MSDFSLRGERRRVAYHEGGHAVTGRHFGLRVTAILVERTHTRDDGSTFKMWEGVANAPWNTLTAHQQRVTGVAGSVALYCWEAYRDKEPSEVPPLDAIIDRMSEGDWAVQGEIIDYSTCDERPWLRAIKTAHRLLNHETGPLWRELRREANNLMRHKFIYVPDWRYEEAA